MAYYLRVFCTRDDVPPLQAAFDAVAHQRTSLELEPGSSDVDATAGGWHHAAVRYNPERETLLVQVSRRGDDLLAEEIDEFLEVLEDAEVTSERDRVIAHLRRSTAVIGVQLANDVDDDGFAATSRFIAFFAERCGGLVQADGEGFYDGDRLVVPLD